MTRMTHVIRTRRQHGSMLMVIPKAVKDRFLLVPGDYIVVSPEEIPGAFVVRSLEEYHAHVQRSDHVEDGGDNSGAVREPAE